MAAIFASSTQPLSPTLVVSNNNATPSIFHSFASSLKDCQRLRCSSHKKTVRFSPRVTAMAAVATPPVEEIKEVVLPKWAMFELGRAPVYWKTLNGLPPTAGEKVKLFYNPAATNLVPNEEFGIGFNGGFNQPIMCSGEPRAMLEKSRGTADSPIYTIQICVPKHALNIIFSFTNGVEWDGPYRLQFQVPKPWQNKPVEFFNEGLAEELSKDGACDRAIFPDTDIVSTRCAIMGNLSAEGGDRCDLNFVLGCMDPSSPQYDPSANVDDGSCPIDTDSE